jgi:hypothetical protein
VPWQTSPDDRRLHFVTATTGTGYTPTSTTPRYGRDDHRHQQTGATAVTISDTERTGATLMTVGATHDQRRDGERDDDHSDDTSGQGRNGEVAGDETWAHRCGQHAVHYVTPTVTRKSGISTPLGGTSVTTPTSTRPEPRR